MNRASESLTARFFTASALARVVASAMLFAALGRHPYGFYQLLRLVVCGVSAYSAYTANNSGQIRWTWLLGLIALLFNPFVPIYLSRADWLPIDLLVAVVLLVSVGFV